MNTSEGKQFAPDELLNQAFWQGKQDTVKLLMESGKQVTHRAKVRDTNEPSEKSKWPNNEVHRQFTRN